MIDGWVRFRYGSRVANRRETARERLRRAAVAGRRSTLYRWMQANFEEFSEILAEAGRPNWRAIADVLAAEGLRNLRGEPPTSEGTRLTWFKVRQAVAARRRKPPSQSRPRNPLATSEQPHTAEPAVATGPSRADEQIARMDRLFQSRKGKMPDPL